MFVYDGFGKLIAEYSTEQALSPTVNYTATDPLGSPRVITNKQGEVLSRRDFMPFGEEITPDASYRTAALKYGVADGVRQKFTGYQRDEETDLDFAEARYYYNDHGRFTAVDPLLASGKSANPQTFNRYAYTMNRPLILTDSKGLQAGKKAPAKKERQTPPRPEELRLTNAQPEDKYQIKIVSFAAIAINDGVITDADGKVVTGDSLRLKDTTDGYGVVLTYELNPGTIFPAPDKGTKVYFEEEITNSKLDGAPAPKGNFADKPVEGKIVDGKVVFTDWIGITNNAGGPTQVSTGDQTIKITATVDGNTETWVIRKNHITIDPKGPVKIKVEEIAHEQPGEEDEL